MTGQFKNIDPRCINHNMPGFVSASGQFRPCAFINTVNIWDKFQYWITERGGDPTEFDLRHTTITDITNTKTWQIFISCLKDGDLFDECKEQCGDSGYASTDNVAKWVTYKISR
jgi:hypothetical protein